MKPCACGCGQPVKPGKYWDSRNQRWRTARYVNHHQGNPDIARWAGAGGRAAALSGSREKHFVSAAPLQALLRDRGMRAADLARLLGVTPPTARYYRNTARRFRKATAERILRVLGGLPRQPSLAEQRATDEVMERRRRADHARQRRELRAKKAQERAS